MERERGRERDRVTSDVRVDAGNSVVIYKQSAQSVEMGQVFELNNLIVGEIDGVELVFSGSEVFNNSNLIT